MQQDMNEKSWQFATVQVVGGRGGGPLP